MNLLQFPLSVLSSRPASARNEKTNEIVVDPETGKRQPAKTIYYQDTILHPKTQKLLQRRVTITGSDKYGLPTSDDEDVIIALQYLTKQANNFSDSRVHFQRRELLETLAWPAEGKYYNRLRDSFARLRGVTVVYENFWDAVEKRFCDATFGILNEAKIFDERTRSRSGKEQLTLPLSYFEWNHTLFSNFAQGYVKELDVDLFFQISTAPAKRAMRFLDDHLPPDGTRIKIDLREFCCERVGLSRDYKNSRLKDLCQNRIVEPLEEIEFLKSMPANNRFAKTGRSYTHLWVARRNPIEPKLQYVPLFDDLELADGPNRVLVDQLTDRGLGRKVAEQLVAKKSETLIANQIAYFDFVIETKPEAITNRGGYLRKAIEEEFGQPAGYLPKDERDRLAQELADRQRQDKTKQSEQRRLEQLEAARRNHIHDTLNSLDKVQRQRLEEQALANASAEERSAIENEELGSGLILTSLLHREVLRQYPFSAAEK